MDLLGHHLRGHFEMHKEVFAVLLGHGCSKQRHGEQTNSQYENRPISEHICSQRVHHKKHSRVLSEYPLGRSKGRKVIEPRTGSVPLVPRKWSMSDMAIYRQRLSLSPSLSPKSRLNVREVLTLP